MEPPEEGGVASLLVSGLSEPWMDESYVSHIFSELGAPPVGCHVADPLTEDSLSGSALPQGFACVQLASHAAASALLRETTGAVPALYPGRYALRPARTPRFRDGAEAEG